MPIYEYRCERGHTFEVLQRMADDPVSVCTSCNASVQRVLHPVAVHFKGSGFYSTDYGKKGRGSGDSGESKSESKSESKNGSGGEKAAKEAGTTAGSASKSSESSKTGSSASE